MLLLSISALQEIQNSLECEPTKLFPVTHLQLCFQLGSTGKSDLQVKLFRL